jgi:hypothetical protein
MSHDPLCELSQVECGCACAEWLRKHDYQMKGGCDNCGCLCDLIGKVRDDQKKRDRGDMWALSMDSLGQAVLVKKHVDQLVAEVARLTYWREL